MKERIRQILKSSGAADVGFASAGQTSDEEKLVFSRWLEHQCNGDMKYLERHKSLRETTDNVLPGAKTVISLAFSYLPKQHRDVSYPMISAYAYGEDYHNVLRRRLAPKVKQIKDEFGGDYRICIDSAPVAERYWALRSGIGFLGMNGMVMTEAAGSYCFLVEVLTTLAIVPDSPSLRKCEGCGACFNNCPAKALNDASGIDARRCLNFLTIEKKGNYNPEEKELITRGKGSLYGCDICQRVCPHNRDVHPSSIPEFQLSPLIANLRPEDILSMTEVEFRKIFRNSPMLWAGFNKLKLTAEVLCASFSDNLQ